MHNKKASPHDTFSALVSWKRDKKGGTREETGETGKRTDRRDGRNEGTDKIGNRNALNRGQGKEERGERS